eukprot:TRINITY_DN95_c0_g1_i1.p2 TRINITY_DN95_c0_g1~~TRINITY_DN95_c0_g1_i1.p2  ORF type:complete len:392 (-),score=150.18 TRINITY_DN95_c0_g1_i1:197-1372(-)
MKGAIISLLLVCILSVSVATVYFEDDFSDTDYLSRWVVSENKVDEGTAGAWGLSAGQYFLDEANQGLQTTEDARFYTISSLFPKEFSNKDSELVIQFSVKHEQKLDCGGGYIKIFPKGFDQKTFNGDSEYNIMFGPDICGSGHKIVHFILNKNGENHLIQKNIDAKTDVFTHTYTLNLKPTNEYGLYIDGELIQEGKIEDDFDILEPKLINDPEVTKPEDWDDAKFIDDPEDVKPADYDDVQPMITDESAEQPEDWDTEEDGEWEAPQIPNPDYQGPWRAKRIDNPNYSGVWEHPQVANPEYVADDSLYLFESNVALGLELWQVKSGSIFSNFLVSDDLEAALAIATERKAVTEAETAAKTAAEDAAAEELKAQAEAAAAEQDDEEDKDDL